MVKRPGACGYWKEREASGRERIDVDSGNI